MNVRISPLIAFGKCGHSFCVLILSLKTFLRVFAFLRLVTDYRSKGKEFGREKPGTDTALSFRDTF